MKEKIIFCGTSTFAAIILEELLKNNVSISHLICQPDKPVGRKRELTPPPAKKIATKYNVPVLQPIKASDETFLTELKSLNPDVIIVAAYGQILKQAFLDIPKHGCLNIHPSKLPLYRGASPLQWAIKNGDTQTSVSLMLMDAKMDHGPILLQEDLELTEKETFSSLQEKTAVIAANMLQENLSSYFEGKILPKEQAHEEATFTKILKREDGKINWEQSAHQIDWMIRAYEQFPGTYTEILLNGTLKRLKILKAETLSENTNEMPGTIILYKKELAVKCSEGILILKEVQPENKSKMTGADFLRGYPNILGTEFQ